MKPDSATLQLGQKADVQLALADGSVDFDAFAATVSGELVPIPEDAETRWFSTNPSVFTVSDKGVVIIQGK